MRYLVILFLFIASIASAQTGRLYAKYLGHPVDSFTPAVLTYDPDLGHGVWSTEGIGNDSIEFSEDSVCIIDMGVEVCVELDSIYFTDSTLCYIELADTNCVEWTTSGGNIYTIDGALISNRTVGVNNFYLQFNRGVVPVFRINAAGSSPAMQFNQNVVLDNFPLFNLTNTSTLGNIYFSWYGANGNERYSMGVDRFSDVLSLAHGTDIGLGDAGSITGDPFMLFDGPNDIIETKKDMQFFAAIVDQTGNYGTAGDVLTSTGTTVEWQPSGVGGGGDSIPINQLKDATATRTLSNANLTQEWQWNTLTSGTGLKLSSSATGAASSTQKLFEVSMTGNNATADQATHGIYVSNARGGTNPFNYGVYATTTGEGYSIYGRSTDGYGVYGHSDNATGLRGFSQSTLGAGVQGINNTSGYGGIFQSSSGTGLWGLSTTGLAFLATTSPTSTNTVVPVARLTRSSSGTPANEIGGSLEFYNRTTTTEMVTNSIRSIWADATQATRTSRLEITGVNSGSAVTHLTITGAGIFTLVQGLSEYADDAAAAAGGIPVGGLYRTGSVVKIRVS